MTRMTVFIDRLASAGGARPLHMICLDRGMIIDEDPRLGSNVYIVPTPGSLPEMTELVVILNGAVVCDPVYIESDGQRGTCVIYTSAVTVGGSRARPREWWASAEFRRTSRIAYALLQHFSRQAKSVWAEIVDYETFAAHVGVNMRGPQRQHRPLQAIGFFSDVQFDGLAPKPYFFSLATFVGKFQTMDAAGSKSGVCGM